MLRRLAVAAAVTSSLAFAQDAGVPVGPVEPPPAAAIIEQVVEYLENGKDRGPALIDLVPCLKVDQTKGSPTAFQCIEPVSGSVKKGTTVFGWMQWYVPKDGKYEDVQLQFLHEGQVRQTVDLNVTGYGRSRVFRGSNFNKIGKWTLRISRGEKELGAATVEVVN